MKAVVLKTDNQIHYMDAPKPALRSGEVLVRVKACGICGSDIRYLEGENPWSQQTLGYVTQNPDNMILGHEFAGEDVEVKDKKDEYLLGKKVGVIVYNTCKSCEFCRTGRMNLCKNTKHIGHGAGWGEMEFYPGGMAEYCQVWSDHVYPFENATFEEVSTLDFVAVGLAAVSKIKKVFAEDAVIIGTGPVGLSIIQLLKLKGARRVYCVDILDYAFEAAREVGADGVFNSAEVDVVPEILSGTDGLGAAMVFDTVGTEETQKMALAVCKGEGTVVNLVCNTTKVQYQLKDFSSERSIVSVANASDDLFYDCLKMLEAGRLNVKPLITDILPLEKAQEGFERLMNREETGAIKVILKP